MDLCVTGLLDPPDTDDADDDADVVIPLSDDVDDEDVEEDLNDGA